MRRATLERTRRSLEYKEKTTELSKHRSVRNRLERGAAAIREREGRESSVEGNRRAAELARRHQIDELRTSVDLADTAKVGQLQQREMSRRQNDHDREAGALAASQQYAVASQRVTAEREKTRLAAVRATEAKEYTGQLNRTYGNYKNTMSSIQLG